MKQDVTAGNGGRLRIRYGTKWFKRVRKDSNWWQRC